MTAPVASAAWTSSIVVRSEKSPQSVWDGRIPGDRWNPVRQSIRHATPPLALALVMDGVFQYLTLGRIRILAAVIVGALLVWLPFLEARALDDGASPFFANHQR
jgi:hypothetical protein